MRELSRRRSCCSVAARGPANSVSETLTVWPTSARRDALAELTVALSLATDLGTGQPMEHGLRTCWLSLARRRRRWGWTRPTRSCVYYVALLRFLGCTSDAAETAVLAGGDDVAFNATMAPMLMARPGEGMRYFVRHLGGGPPDAPPGRAGSFVRWPIRAGAAQPVGPLRGRRPAGGAARSGRAVCDALAHAYERWDGKGYPGGPGRRGGAAGGAYRRRSPVTPSCGHARRGWPVAAEVLAHRRGHAYDPAVVDAFVERRRAVAGRDRRRPVRGGAGGRAGAGADDRDDELDAALARGGRLHRPEVAVLARPLDRCRRAGGRRRPRPPACPTPMPTALGRAALVHDVGRVGVPSGIWDRPGPLSAEQWERVRLHPYLTERVLHRCALLAPFAEVAARHHERADGSGYHRGASGDQLDVGRSAAGGRRRLSRDDRGPAAPAGAQRRRRRVAAAR